MSEPDHPQDGFVSLTAIGCDCRSRFTAAPRISLWKQISCEQPASADGDPHPWAPGMGGERRCDGLTPPAVSQANFRIAPLARPDLVERWPELLATT